MVIAETTLFESLKKINSFRDYEDEEGNDPIEWETAHAICEIHSELNRISQLMRDISEKSPNIAEDALLELRECVRHIAYHIVNSRFLSVVLDSVRE